MKKWLLKAIKGISLVDLFLLVFAAVIMAEMIYSVIFNVETSEVASNFELSLKPIMASIFGYFLSVNFISTSSSGRGTGDVVSVNNEQNKNQLRNLQVEPTDAPKNVIGFDTSESGNSGLTGNERELGVITDFSEVYEYVKKSNENSLSLGFAEKQQIVIVSLLGLISVFVILIKTNNAYIDNNSIATLTQFRNMASSSIGFLIGYPVNRK